MIIRTALFLLIAVFTQCTKPEYKQIIVLEAENFTLADAEIINDEKASGGKAVRLNAFTSTGSSDVILEPGSYIMTAFEYAFNPGQNGFYAGIGDSFTRIYPMAFRQWSETYKFHSFEITKKGVYKIRFCTHLPNRKIKSEKGMLIDKFVIKKL
jgi:hypothetical protein